MSVPWKAARARMSLRPKCGPVSMSVSARGKTPLRSKLRSALVPIDPRTTIHVEGGIGQQPMEPVPRNQALWRVACEAGQRLGLQLDQAEVGGASDGNTTSQYTATLAGPR